MFFFLWIKFWCALIFPLFFSTKPSPIFLNEYFGLNSLILHLFWSKPTTRQVKGFKKVLSLNSITSLVLPLFGLPNLISFIGPLPFIFLGFLNSPGKSTQNLSPYIWFAFWKYAFKFVFDLVLNSKTPLVFIAHAARALEDLTGSIEAVSYTHLTLPTRNCV